MPASPIKKKEIMPCSICGYYEDTTAYHYDDCPKLIEMGLVENENENNN